MEHLTTQFNSSPTFTNLTSPQLEFNALVDAMTEAAVTAPIFKQLCEQLLAHFQLQPNTLDQAQAKFSLFSFDQKLLIAQSAFSKLPPRLTQQLIQTLALNTTITTNMLATNQANLDHLQLFLLGYELKYKLNELNQIIPNFVQYLLYFKSFIIRQPEAKNLIVSLIPQLNFLGGYSYLRTNKQQACQLFIRGYKAGIYAIEQGSSSLLPLFTENVIRCFIFSIYLNTDFETSVNHQPELIEKILLLAAANQDNLKLQRLLQGLATIGKIYLLAQKHNPDNLRISLNTGYTQLWQIQQMGMQHAPQPLEAEVIQFLLSLWFHGCAKYMMLGTFIHNQALDADHRQLTKQAIALFNAFSCQPQLVKYCFANLAIMFSTLRCSAQELSFLKAGLTHLNKYHTQDWDYCLLYFHLRLQKSMLNQRIDHYQLG